MKLKILILLFLATRATAQVKIEFSINTSNNIAEISINNMTEDYYLIPLDMTSLRPYYNNICLDMIEYTYPYPVLGLNILLKKDNRIVDSSANSEIPNDTVIAGREFKKLNNLKIINEKKIISWQKKNGIKDFETAKNNFYIFNNILYLKPKQVIKFKSKFNLDNITDQKYFHSYFPRNKYDKYMISLYYDVQPCIYNYLTSDQKKRLIKYKFFLGKLESNVIELKH